ncbi:amino acid ABC transporter membrane protein, PAAT family [Seinonella peptonophila]|uniref:Amino acid ABC transporter membrane protein, PAAT family n=1 Tax=Seinonella peptonophila TaxID=112248 RepID=A0A1M4SMK9_9BACL|nr:amino acid ABC transporter permease [Seinonella peptonophila]SHE33408.1 amino acid ABC transporter membrane protein, PAAT family [Seinonella peptonophila]
MSELIKDVKMFFPALLEGAWLTIELTVISLILALIVGLFIGLGRISRNRIIYRICSIYVSIIRGTPLLVQLVYVYFVFPDLGIELTPFQAGIIGLSINESAYLAEIFRAGIKSVPKGQTEAAQSLGMNYSLAMRRIILPQAIRNALPPIGNSAIILLKNSSLAAVITVGELMHQGEIIAAATFKNMEIFTMVAIMYWILHYPISLLVDYLEKRGDHQHASAERH